MEDYILFSSLNLVDLKKKLHHFFCPVGVHLVKMSIDDFFFIIFNMTFKKTTFIFGETSRVCKGDPHNIIYLCNKQYIYNTRCSKKIFVFHEKGAV
jgi:hypothetical protein